MGRLDGFLARTRMPISRWKSRSIRASIPTRWPRCAGPRRRSLLRGPRATRTPRRWSCSPCRAMTEIRAAQKPGLRSHVVSRVDHQLRRCVPVDVLLALVDLRRISSRRWQLASTFHRLMNSHYFATMKCCSGRPSLS